MRSDATSVDVAKASLGERSILYIPGTRMAFLLYVSVRAVLSALDGQMIVYKSHRCVA